MEKLNYDIMDFETEVREAIIRTVAKQYENVQDGDEMTNKLDTADFNFDEVIISMFKPYFDIADEIQASYIIEAVRNDLKDIQDYVQQADVVEPKIIEAYI